VHAPNKRGNRPQQSAASENDGVWCEGERPVDVCTRSSSSHRHSLQAFFHTMADAHKLPRLTVNAGPRDDEAQWSARLKEELAALIAAVRANKGAGADWFTIAPVGTRGLAWAGTAWATHDLRRYKFAFEFETPAAYPAAPPAIRIPALDGKTAKMYRGGAICLDAHFAPLWARAAPGYGIVHALALGLGPWLAAEVPLLAAAGAIVPEGGGGGGTA